MNAGQDEQSEMKRVYLSSRILNRETGGNTTYARNLRDALILRGNYSIRELPCAQSRIGTIVAETRFGRKKSAGLAHYVADTGPLLTTKRPSVVTVHGVASRWQTGIRSPVAEKLWRFRVERAIRSCRKVITVSATSARDIAETFRYPLDRITVIPHGLDHVHSARGNEAVKLPSEVPDEFILYVGNIEPRKNVGALHAAMTIDPLRSLGLPLVVAGQHAWGEEGLIAAMRRSTSTVYLGYVSDDVRNELLRRCALFVFPSWYEGFGFPVLEALSLGTPVACSDRGSLADVAGPSQLLPDLTAEGLANGVAAALSNSEWLIDAATDGPAWSSKFTWDASARTHEHVYRMALDA